MGVISWYDGEYVVLTTNCKGLTVAFQRTAKLCINPRKEGIPGRSVGFTQPPLLLSIWLAGIELEQEKIVLG